MTISNRQELDSAIDVAWQPGKVTHRTTANKGRKWDPFELLDWLSEQGLSLVPSKPAEATMDEVFWFLHRHGEEEQLSFMKAAIEVSDLLRKEGE